MLYITHDIASAARSAEEVVVISPDRWSSGAKSMPSRQSPPSLYPASLSAVPDPDRPFAPGRSARFLAHADEVRRLSLPASDAGQEDAENHFVRALGQAPA